MSQQPQCCLTPPHVSLSLVQLAERGDQVLLENLAKRCPEVLSEKDENGASPLHHAAAGGYTTLIQFITAFGDPEGRRGPQHPS